MHPTVEVVIDQCMRSVDSTGMAAVVQAPRVVPNTEFLLNSTITGCMHDCAPAIMHRGLMFKSTFVNTSYYLLHVRQPVTTWGLMIANHPVGTHRSV